MLSFYVPLSSSFDDDDVLGENIATSHSFSLGFALLTHRFSTQEPDGGVEPSGVLCSFMQKPKGRGGWVVQKWVEKQKKKKKKKGRCRRGHTRERFPLIISHGASYS